MWKIALLDDDPIILEIIKHQLLSIKGVHAVQTFTDLSKLVSSTHDVDIIFLDIYMAPVNGIQAIPIIRKQYPILPIVILSSSEEDDVIIQTLKLGAIGYLLKSDIAQLTHHLLETICKGESIMTPRITRKVINFFSDKPLSLHKLTPRENSVATEILNGLSYKMIANKLDISIDTVRMNIKNIYKKLNVNSKAELFKTTHVWINSPE